MKPVFLSISTLAEKTGCSVPTIRYYEQIGLLPLATRTSGGHRHYRESDLRRLRFIKRCRDFGFSVEQVRELVAMSEDGDGHCVEVRDRVQAQLELVRSKLAQLRELESSLASFVAECDSECVGGANRDCCIIEDLAAKPASAVSCGSACSVPMNGIEVSATELRRRR
jgi:DNA-binding transcriptional MerR regulator